MRLPLPTALAVALILTGCGSPGTQSDDKEAAVQALSVTGAIVQLPAVPGRPGAAYFTVRAGAQADRLTAVSSDRVERIDLHETRMEGDVMRMGPLADASIPAGGSLAFEQGGRHAMLFGVDPALKAGDKVGLTFSFASGNTVDSQAEVRALGGVHGAAH